MKCGYVSRINVTLNQPSNLTVEVCPLATSLVDGSPEGLEGWLRVTWISTEVGKGLG